MTARRVPPAWLDRRQLLAAGGALLTSCGAGARLAPASDSRLDHLLAAHAGLLPERAGAGANHYPMAAEVLAALGYEREIDDAWVDGAALYAGELGRARPIVDEADVSAALGRYGRFGDWLDHFRAALAREPWRAVVGHWAPRLAPAMCAAAYHGVIRTGHAVRALGQHDTAARRDELATGLAYWAARYVELPTNERAVGREPRLGETLARLSSPWVDDRGDVAFDAVVERLVARPLAPPVELAETGAAPATDLDELVREAATAFLEMLVLERNRIWLLHTVTGPAAVGWLLPEVDPRGARRLVEYARQSVVAMYAAYGEPFDARAHLRGSPGAWPELIQRAVDSRSVHGIKLIDALHRFDRGSDPLWRSVAARWFEWT
ncbi:MAG: questin oxidase family protein [Planctomycetota bacterium]